MPCPFLACSIPRFIEEAKIFGDFFNSKDVSEIETAIVGKAHREGDLRTALSAFEIEDYFHQMSEDDLIAALF